MCETMVDRLRKHSFSEAHISQNLLVIRQCWKVLRLCPVHGNPIISCLHVGLRKRNMKAPLDNSFQKDRLELVNKGSLSQRRKPSRSNLKFLLSPVDDTCINTSPVVSSKENSIRNEKRIESVPLTNCNNRQQIHSNSSLPLNTVNQAAEEHRTTQVRLQRKPSDVGRSTVLIQTWERRTRQDAILKQRNSLKKSSASQFYNRRNMRINKENYNTQDPYSPARNEGILQNGNFQSANRSFSKIRNAISMESLNDRFPKNSVRSNSVESEKTTQNEPEWISLSRKLCAKFVEGHIENHSSDSYAHEEPEGVKPPCHPPTPRVSKEPPTPAYAGRTKANSVSSQESSTEEPPWIHLSRKLCTKFIEEHIEYPTIKCGDKAPEKQAEAPIVEPNGDIRIIEKIGNTGGRKSKKKKESEPEWISLSKKLRAKFIESHLDDPDTIALDNQLNASDPEETNSESLSDVSQEIIPQKKTTNVSTRDPPDGSESCLSEDTKLEPIKLVDNRSKTVEHSILNGKECCWDYQELEFDEESSSGTFQEPDTNNDKFVQGSTPIKNSTYENLPRCFSDIGTRIEDQTIQQSNNDVHFPADTNTAMSFQNVNSNSSKHITVQFINNSKECKEKSEVTPQDSNCFELSEWETARYEDEFHSDKERNKVKKEMRSKSMENILDYKDEAFTGNAEYFRSKNENSKSESRMNYNSCCKSEEMLFNSATTEKKYHDFSHQTSDEDIFYYSKPIKDSCYSEHQVDSTPARTPTSKEMTFAHANHAVLRETHANVLAEEKEPETQKRMDNKMKHFSKSDEAIYRNEYANLPPPYADNSAKAKLRHSAYIQSRSVATETQSIGHLPLNEKPKDFKGFNGCRNFNASDKVKVNVFNAAPTEHTNCSSDSSTESIASYEISPVNAVVPQMKPSKLEADVPLCAQLVSKETHPENDRSVSPSSNRIESPCSETPSSHVYEDMFKETTSCPSDSEASSWTVMKSNSYYVNRSCSMNDLDNSDCSMSVKCDYASSGSNDSTLQSRRSSCGSSSFYVNLRDYDAHMLEPGLMRKKKDSVKTHTNSNGGISNGNPRTPESLRHLFKAPFTSINTPPKRTLNTFNTMPSENDSHYYSVTSNTSSAFKHGFDSVPKPKKSERSSSIKIKDIAHGIILTFRRFQNHSKSAHISPSHYVDVSHLAEAHPKPRNGFDSGKPKAKSSSKDKDFKKYYNSENGKTDTDSGCLPDDPKMRRSNSDASGMKFARDFSQKELIQARNACVAEEKKTKSSKKSQSREKGKKKQAKTLDARTPTVSRKVQQMADGTLYLVTTVSGDSTLPGVYSDSPDTSSELSFQRAVKLPGESNC